VSDQERNKVERRKEGGGRYVIERGLLLAHYGMEE
jgi:hypothetical protein